MSRSIEYIGETIEISDYQEKHRLCNQAEIVDDIPVNPLLRADFDSTPNEERYPKEVDDWWNKPYILTCSWEHMSETWDEYSKRAKEWEFEAQPKDHYEADLAQRRVKWFESWPGGVRYDVRCLNGGAWDRSTNLGMYPTLEEALNVCKSYTPVDYGMY